MKPHFPTASSDTCHILGLGPSIKHFKPDGNLTIGCNDIFRICPVDFLIVVSVLPADRNDIVWRSRPKKLLSFLPAWASHPAYEYMGILHPWRQDRKNPMNKGMIYHSNNTPFIQASYAFNMGYKNIVLWGVDLMDHPLLRDQALEKTWTDFKQLQAAFLENDCSMYLGSSGSVLSLPPWS